TQRPTSAQLAGGAPIICSSPSQRSVATVAMIPTSTASIAASSVPPQETPFIEKTLSISPFLIALMEEGNGSHQEISPAARYLFDAAKQPFPAVKSPDQPAAA